MQEFITIAEGIAGLSTLASLLRGAGPSLRRRAPAPLTLLAPTDEAFAALPRGALDLIRAEPASLDALLLGHILPGALMAADLMELSSVVALGGQAREVDAELGLRVGHAYLVHADIPAGTGVVHMVDAVLLA